MECGQLRLVRKREFQKIRKSENQKIRRPAPASTAISPAPKPQFARVRLPLVNETAMKVWELRSQLKGNRLENVNINKVLNLLKTGRRIVGH